MTDGQITNLQEAENVTRERWVTWFNGSVELGTVPTLSESRAAMEQIAAKATDGIEVVSFLTANPTALQLKTWSFSGENVEEAIRLAVKRHTVTQCDETLTTVVKAANAPRLMAKIDNAINRASEIILATGGDARTKDALDALEALRLLHADTFSLPNLNRVVVCFLKLRNALGKIIMLEGEIEPVTIKATPGVISALSDLIELRGMDYIWFQNSLQENLAMSIPVSNSQKV